MIIIPYHSFMNSFINIIIKHHFHEPPLNVVRFTTGICNEVFAVTLSQQTVVLRLNKDDTQMRGSEKYIPLFKAHGITVPTILFSDYSKQLIPYSYQITTHLLGKDLGQVISQLSHAELTTIAGEVAHVFKKLDPLPTNGLFGYVYGDDSKLKNSWTEIVQHMANLISEQGSKTGTLNAEWRDRAQTLVTDNTAYFASVQSKFYYDDISSKNILIHNGKFSGLVDLDGVAYGDYLEAIGRIYASWYGTDYGKFYSEQVMTACNLSSEQRQKVVMYALLDRMEWLTENGIQFNQNTSSTVNWDQVKVDTIAVEGLWVEYQR